VVVISVSQFGRERVCARSHAQVTAEPTDDGRTDYNALFTLEQSRAVEARGMLPEAPSVQKRTDSQVLT